MIIIFDGVLRYLIKEPLANSRLLQELNVFENELSYIYVQHFLVFSWNID